MLPYRDSRITQIAIAVFFVIIAVYAFYEVRAMLFGPQISVSSAISEVHEPFIVLKGHADRIAKLSMNGKPITVTEDGAFEEPYLLSEGLNRISLDAEDKYGRARPQVLQIVYTPTPGASAPDTTTATTSTSTVAQ